MNEVFNKTHLQSNQWNTGLLLYHACPTETKTNYHEIFNVYVSLQGIQSLFFQYFQNNAMLPL